MNYPFGSPGSSSHLVLDALFRDYKDTLDSVERAIKLGGEDTIGTKRRMEDELDEIMDMDFDEEDFQSDAERQKYVDELNDLKNRASNLKKELRGEAPSAVYQQQPAKSSKKPSKLEEKKDLSLNNLKKSTPRTPRTPLTPSTESNGMKDSQNLSDIPGIEESNVAFVTKQAKAGDVKELDDVMEITQDNTRILERMKGRSEETVHIATDIAVTLKQQTEQLMQIQREVDQLGTGVKRARKELWRFTVRMACDKLILALIVLIILTALLIFVAYILVRLICPQCLNIDWSKLFQK